MVPGLNMVEEGNSPAALIAEHQDGLRLLDSSGLFGCRWLSTLMTAYGAAAFNVVAAGSAIVLRVTL